MSVRVALVNPPVRLMSGEPKYAQPPLGLAYIAANLRLHGHSVRIFDCLTQDYEHETTYSDGGIGYGASPEALIEEMESFAPDLVGISCIFTISSQISIDVAKVIKERFPQTPIVFGGTHATVNSHSMAAVPGVDYVVRGEGEDAVVQLADHLAGDRDICEVSGLTYRVAGEIKENKQQFIQDLDKLPRPARDLLDMETYFSIGRMQGMSPGMRKRITPMITSRGCPAQCIFCAIHAVWGRKFRAHSAAYVIEEISELRDKWGVEHLLFEDDNLTFDKDRAVSIFQGLLDTDIHMTWDTPNGVALWRLDEKVIRLMKQTGCQLMSVAIESGDQETLYNIIKKPLNLKKAEKVILAARDIKLRTSAFFVVGFPGETMERIKKSLDYAVSIPTDSIALMIATPYVGTRLYEQCKENGYLVEDFDPYNLYPRKGQIITDEFTPDELDKLVSQTHLRRAFRFPLNTMRRVYEKFSGDKRSFLEFIYRRMLALAAR